jgi:hypothetical protein
MYVCMYVCMYAYGLNVWTEMPTGKLQSECGPNGISQM